MIVLVITAVCCFQTPWAGSVATCSLFLVNLSPQLSKINKWSQRLFWLNVGVSLSFIFYNYTADLTSAMTVSPKLPGIKDVQDLTGYDVKMTKSTSARSKLKSAKPGSPLRVFYERKVMNNPQAVWKNTSYSFIKESLDADGNIAFLTSYYYVRHMKGLTVSKLDLSEEIAVGLQKDSELKIALDFQLLKLKETGVLSKLIRRSRWDHKKHENRPPPQAFSLGYENLLFPFICFIAGIILSTILALIEKVGMQATRDFNAELRKK